MTTAPHVFENHDEAYHIWKRAGFAGKTLVHVDAHHDMSWLTTPAELTIGNYVCQAIKEGIAREVFWIVPDPTWRSAPSRKRLYRAVRGLAKSYPHTQPRVNVTDDRMTTELVGVPVTIGPLASLSGRADDVLLDIDTDFMLIPLVCSHIAADADIDRPWIWPAELASRLRVAEISPAATTIAYSVDGGYTPLHWKFLGAALAAELEPAGHRRERVRCGLGHLREATEAASRGDIESATVACKRAQESMPDDAAPAYNLARWYAKANRLSEARALCRTALDLDASYATAYNNRGPWYRHDRRLADAEREYRFALALNPTDRYAQFGLAQVTVARKRWGDAAGLLQSVLDSDPDFIDALRLLGDVRVEQGRDEEAADAYRRTLTLAMRGVPSLKQRIGGVASMTGRHDVNQGSIHAQLAWLDEKHGRLTEAAAGYQLGIAGRSDAPVGRMRLARTYAKQGRWRSAGWEALAAGGNVPAAVRRSTRRLRTAIRRRISRI